MPWCFFSRDIQKKKKESLKSEIFFIYFTKIPSKMLHKRLEIDISANALCFLKIDCVMKYTVQISGSI